MLNMPRVILYHKQKTSARTLFLTLNETVCLFDGLPPLATVLDEDYRSPLALHPAAPLAQTEQRLHLPAGSLEAEGDFQVWVDTPNGPLAVLLARFTAIDPPREAVPLGRFIALTEARSLPPAELELLRRAYAVIMEG